jgi:hypothetical protein
VLGRAARGNAEMVHIGTLKRYTHTFRKNPYPFL